MSGFTSLCSPGIIGNLTLKNRFVMSPMGSSTSDEQHRFTEQSYAYYEERATGGFGLLFTGYLCVSPDGLSYPNQVQIYDDSAIPFLQELTERVHLHGAKIFAQLQHSGMQNDYAASGNRRVGPSAIEAPFDCFPVHELTKEEILDLEDRFAAAAVRAKKAGFDGVEIHGAHGYLVTQFLSKARNKRNDEYGGGPSGRAEFACEIIRKIRRAVGDDFPISIRINAVDDVPGGNTIEDSCAQAILLEEAGADVINVSRGLLESGMVIPSNYTQEGLNIDLARKIRSAVSIPVITVGRLNDPALAEYALRSGAADFAAFGRQSIADPHFPEKVMEGRLNEIFTCTGCLQRCQGAPCDADDTGVSCLVNPLSGKEYRWQIRKTEKPQKILIAGAGCSGLEAAWILAAKGHQVTVMEKEQKYGGQLNLAGVPPMKYPFGRIADTYMTLGRKYGAQYIFGKEVTADTLRQMHPDIVLLATGSTPLRPRIPGINGKNVIAAQDILSGKVRLSGEKLLLAGAGLVGCESADYLLGYQNEITIVDMVSSMASQLHPWARDILLKILEDGKVNFIPGARILEFTDDGAVCEKNGEKQRLSGFSHVILAMGSRPYAPLKEEAEKICGRVYLIGDAQHAGDAKLAIYQAAKLAMEL